MVLMVNLKTLSKPAAVRRRARFVIWLHDTDMAEFSDHLVCVPG